MLGSGLTSTGLLPVEEGKIDQHSLGLESEIQAKLNNSGMTQLHGYNKNKGKGYM